MKTTKLDRAVERLERCLAQYDPEDLLAVVPSDLRTVLKTLKSRPAPSAVQRAERAVVRAAMRFTAHDVRMNFGKLDTLCIRVLAERMKAKKARRP